MVLYLPMTISSPSCCAKQDPCRKLTSATNVNARKKAILNRLIFSSLSCLSAFSLHRSTIPASALQTVPFRPGYPGVLCSVDFDFVNPTDSALTSISSYDIGRTAFILLHYSYLRLSVGFAKATLNTWELTVNTAMAKASRPLMRNIQREREVRKAKPWSQRLMSQ
jgi:hypothetical protein